MASVNDAVADEILTHAVNLDRFAADVRQRVFTLLLALEKDLLRELRENDFTGPVRVTYRLRRLQRLLEQTQETIRTYYTEISKVVTSDLRSVSGLTATATAGAVNISVGAEIMTVALAPEQLRALADDTLIEGAPTKTWWSRQAGDTRARFEDKIRQGYARGYGMDEITRSVRGTAELNYTDGVMQTPKRNAEALVRSSVQAVSNNARLQVFEANSDVVNGVQQISTLDSRTTHICKAYSHKVWKLPNYEPVGHGLAFNGGPPRHWNCRSVLTAWLRSFDELTNKDKRKVEDAGTQVSMDGQVSAALDYEEWLKTKSTSFQREILGPGRYRLWKEGKISFTDLVDQRGNPLSLAELERRFGGR